jgi:hypothetical protein
VNDDCDFQCKKGKPNPRTITIKAMAIMPWLELLLILHK